MEEELLGINQTASNSNEDIINNIKQNIEQIILYRSLYILKKKFELNKEKLKILYEDFNINTSKRIDALGACQIDVNDFIEITQIILKELNIFLLKLTSPKDIFLSSFIINSQKYEEMLSILSNIKTILITNNLIKKYNQIFYEKKIKPLFDNSKHLIKENKKIQEYSNEVKRKKEKDNNSVAINSIKIVEYNKKGKILNKINLLIEEDIENSHINNNDTNNAIKIDNSIIENTSALYIETLPVILADYFQENKNYAIIELEDELSQELDMLFNKKLLIKINEYDELLSKNTKNKDVDDKMNINLQKLNEKLKKIERNIYLYEQILINKKNINENNIFIQDMLNKLHQEKKNVKRKIYELKGSYNPENNSTFNGNSYIMNTMKTKNSTIKLEDINHLHKNMNKCASSLSIRSNFNGDNFQNGNNNVFNSMQLNNNINVNENSEFTSSILKVSKDEDQINDSIKEIYIFYSLLDKTKKQFDMNSFYKFASDFKIPLPEKKLCLIYNQSCNGLIMNLNEFKLSLYSVSKEVHNIKIKKIVNEISDIKNIIDIMELKENQRQNEEKNHNKFTEKTTGGIQRRALEKNQYEYISRYKKLNDDINNYEYEYYKLNKKSDKEILWNFYRYLGILNKFGYLNNGNFRKKMRINRNNAIKNYNMQSNNNLNKINKSSSYKNIFHNIINNDYYNKNTESSNLDNTIFNDFNKKFPNFNYTNSKNNFNVNKVYTVETENLEEELCNGLNNNTQKLTKTKSSLEIPTYQNNYNISNDKNFLPLIKNINHQKENVRNNKFDLIKFLSRPSVIVSGKNYPVYMTSSLIQKLNNDITFKYRLIKVLNEIQQRDYTNFPVKISNINLYLSDDGENIYSMAFSEGD